MPVFCLVRQDGPASIFPVSPWGSQSERRRWIKDNVYAKFPKFFRSLVYFLFCYVFLRGFLDGKAGLVFHVLYGFWYRFLSDAKLLELEKRRQFSDYPPIAQIGHEKILPFCDPLNTWAESVPICFQAQPYFLSLPQSRLFC